MRSSIVLIFFILYICQVYSSAINRKYSFHSRGAESNEVISDSSRERDFAASTVTEVIKPVDKEEEQTYDEEEYDYYSETTTSNIIHDEETTVGTPLATDVELNQSHADHVDVDQPKSLGDNLTTFLSRDESYYGGKPIGEQQETQYAPSPILSISSINHDSAGKPLTPAQQENNRQFSADPDLVYFPDQVEYLQLHAQLCRSDPDLILHPGTGRCYPRGTQGPCHITQTLQLDPTMLLPVCSNTASLRRGSKKPPLTITLRL